MQNFQQLGLHMLALLQRPSLNLEVGIIGAWPDGSTLFGYATWLFVCLLVYMRAWGRGDT